MARTLTIRHVPGCRADNPELLQALPSAILESGEILEALRQSRAASM